MKERFLLFMVGGVVLGFVTGALFPTFSKETSFVGELFLNALKMVVLPLITVSIANAIFKMETLERFRQIGVRALLYYTLTTALAVVTGIGVVLLFKPGASVSFSGSEFHREVTFSFKELILSLIPSNIFKAFVDFDVLPVIVSTILFSLAFLSVDWNRKTVLHQLISELDVALLKLTGWVISLVPVGVCSLIATKVAEMGGAPALKTLFLSLGVYVLTVLTGLFIHGFITLPLLYFLFTRKNPYSLINRVKEALLTAFATASSSATFPVTLSRSIAAGIKREVAEFTLPLGATINMDGTALYEAVAAIFLAQSYGIELSLSQYVAVFLTATLAAIGAAGIPEAGLVTMVLVLQSIGVPTEGIGIILAVDWFLDRCRTAINVLGDIIAAAVISRQLEERDGRVSP